MEDRKYRVVIVGAGTIGAFFDRPGSKDVLTHAHAFSRHPRFELLGFVDSDPEKAEKAAAIWGGRGGTDIAVAHNENADVICVAVPDEQHYPVLKSVFKMTPRIVIAEKPLAKTLKEAEELVSLSRKTHIPVCVNFNRRFVPEIRTTGERYRNGEFGGYLCGTAYYGKGVMHNGSHLIDMVHDILGVVESVDVIDRISDYYPDDPSVSAVLSLANNGKLHVQAVDCSRFTIFELDLIFERRRVRFIDSFFTINEYEPVADSRFKGYRNLEKIATYGTSLGMALYHAADNIAGFLDGREKLRCSIDDGHAAMKVCEQLRTAAMDAV